MGGGVEGGQCRKRHSICRKITKKKNITWDLRTKIFFRGRPMKRLRADGKARILSVPQADLQSVSGAGGETKGYM